MADEKDHQAKVEDPELIKGRRGRTHIDACTRGYSGVTSKHMEVHHVLCIACCTDATISEQLDGNDENIQRIQDCLDLTDWNINDAHNTVGLPKKDAFYAFPSSSWGGWPCHQVDHNTSDGYTDTVSDYLGKNVWKTALETAEDCEFKAKSLESLLKKSSDHWFGWLQTRGGENAGTAFCWDNRFEIAEGKCTDPQVTKEWYHPFSMALNPTQRNPPPDEKTFSKGFEALLSATFGS